MKTSRFASLHWLAAASLLPVLAGCVQLAEVDTTADPKYRAVIGREYALREDFLACGVKHDHPAPVFNKVTIMPPPGLGGRYIVPLGRIPAGSRFRIVGVVNHRSKLFPNTEYVVSFPDHRIPGAEGKPVRIHHVAAWPLYEKPAAPDAAPMLSDRYFRAVEQARP